MSRKIEMLDRSKPTSFHLAEARKAAVNGKMRCKECDYITPVKNGTGIASHFKKHGITAGNPPKEKSYNGGIRCKRRAFRRWTNETWRLVYREAARLNKADFTATASELWREVQGCLAEDLRDNGKIPPPEFVNGVQAEIDAWANPEPVFVNVPVEPDEDELLDKVPLEKLKLHVAMRETKIHVMMEEFLNKISSTPAALAVDTYKVPIVKQVERAAPRRPVVLVIGLLNSQAHNVEGKSKNLNVTLRFIETTSGMRNDTLPRCDYVIVNKHTSHIWWDKAKQLVEAKNVAFCDGGIEATVRYLLKIHQGLPLNGKNENESNRNTVVIPDGTSGT